MIIKEGRSPTMRRVSTTHRVALDLLFDRINLDSRMQIRHIDTKHQFADILTKGNFTRDKWYKLLHLCDISHFSSACCAKNLSLVSCPTTMAKKMQEQKGKEVWQNRNLQRLNLSSHVPTISSFARSPIESNSLSSATGET